MKIKILTLSLFVFCIAKAQNNKSLINAFSQSYENEAILKYDAAIAALNTVYNPSSYEINLRMGWLYYASGKYKESILYYQKAIAAMPAATEPKWAIINPLSKLESWSEIEKIYRSILKIDTRNTTANYNIGLIYYYRKDYVNAKKYFDVALNLAPFNYDYMMMSAWTHYFLGNKNEAMALFNKVLLYSPNDQSALEGLNLIK